MKVMLLLIILATTSSCSSMSYGLLYSADTVKKWKCEGILMESWMLDPIFVEKVYTAEEMKKGDELRGGYTECKTTHYGKDVVIMECQKPMLYKLISSKNRAACDKFMVDNKLL